MKRTGNPVSPGVALGVAYRYLPAVGIESERAGTDFEPGQEAYYEAKLESAIEAATRELDALAASFGADEKAKIFVAHREILLDDEILDLMREAVHERHRLPDVAAREAYAEFIELVSQAKDPLIAARAADYRDVRNRLVRIINGAQAQDLSALPGPVVVVAHDLLPSDTATLDRDNVLAIVTEIGGATSHTAIIANGYGIPAVLGVAGCLDAIADGVPLGVDALSGDVFIDPDAAQREALDERRRAFAQRSAQEAQYRDIEARTADGVRIQVGLNIGSDDDDPGFAYTDFVGLFRTEFLYMHSDHIPDEEAQFQAYRRVVAHAKGKPVTLRTLDIGGDKKLPYLPLPHEDNPFLGRRALRLCFAEPGLLETQLRAALRASAFGPLWIMLPMVGSIEDIDRARAVYDAVRASLRDEGRAVGEDVKLGIMIEIPSIAMVADQAAARVDFASIGTNDLCQYLCAVDRLNPDVSGYYQTYAPAMARVLGRISEAFRAADKPLSVCGEMAGDPRGAVLLAGLGIEKLSMSGSSVARVKAALAGVTLRAAQEVARAACDMATEAEVLSALDAAMAGEG